MDVKQADIIKKMCRDELTQTDVKAICKFRKFSSPRSASPEIVETLITSDVGLKSALNSLTRKEILMLHFLLALNEPVDISAFTRISNQEGYKYGTFTQRYQKLFQDIKQRFIRKGLLAFCEGPDKLNKKTKMERICLLVPVEFQAHLPAMLEHPLKSDQKGIISEDRIRKLLAGISRPDGKPLKQDSSFNIDQDGCLKIGDSSFSIGNLESWQYRQWKTEAAKDMGVAAHLYSFDCLSALKVLFSSLKPDEWIDPEQLEPALDLFCNFRKKPDIDRVCRLGWEMGILETASFETGTCYRLIRHTSEPSGDTFEKHYVTDPDKACIDFKKIPLTVLAQFSKIARFRVENKKIFAAPDPVMMGRYLDDIRDTPWFFRLINHLPEFKHLFQQLEKNWGKEIINRNLLVAQIKHIGLKASLEKALSNEDVLFLPNGFIAFPKGLENMIEKAVVQQGFAVKRVTP
ncbi:MAG: hypothetical protein K9K21_12370 [Desulfotignum sp.]|nr:hypothetical protein [Desulfotignum sp.]MCF8114636.1 hypothetical protein [Desulfotignum sp.]